MQLNTRAKHAVLRFDNEPNDGTEPCFIIAEAGVNHNGSIVLAHRLVDMAADSGADAVKFQTFDPRAVASAGADAAPYQRAGGAGSHQLEMLKDLVLARSAWKELAWHAKERDLVFLSTAFDVQSLQMLLELDVQALKSPSGELDNLPFLARLAGCGRPLIISTGVSTLDEVSAAVQAAKAAPSIALLHCVTAYPAPTEASNLRALRTMTKAFHVPVGWSDHTRGSLTAVAAVALGASILEKHITIDRQLPGPDHKASADPGEFSKYVSKVRRTERALGNGLKRPVPEEKANQRLVRRSYHTTRNLRRGELITESDVTLLRPADGLPPGAKVIGRVVARSLLAGRPVTKADLA